MARIAILLLALGGLAYGQTSPGFIDGAALCANYPNPVCQGQTPTNPLSLNQAFMNKQDVVGGGGAALTTVNMLNFGADPAGVADSCGAGLTNALAALNALPVGGVLYWPTGTYKCGAQIGWSNKSITIQGDGPGLTTLTFTSASANAAGIKISQTSGLNASNVIGLTLLTSVPQPLNNAITIANTDSKKIATTTVLRDLAIGGAGAGNVSPLTYWLNGIYCSGCVFGYFSNINITGSRETLEPAPLPPGGFTSANMFAGININGQGMMPGEASTDITMEGIRIALGRIGVYMSGDSEGAHIHGISTFVLNYGFFLDDWQGSQDPTALIGTPGPFVFGQDCAAYFSCLVVKGWGTTGMYGSQWLKMVPPMPGGDPATPKYAAVQLLDGVYQNPNGPSPPTVTVPTVTSTIIGNQCVGAYDFNQQADLSYICFKLGDHANGNVIQNNLVAFVNDFIDFGMGANPNTVTNNAQSFALNGIFHHWAHGTTSQFTIYHDNRPVNTALDSGIVLLQQTGGTQPVQAGTATPSMWLTQEWVGSPAAPVTVPQPEGALYQINNITTQNISNVLGGYIGQQITMSNVASSSQTIVHAVAGTTTGIILTKPGGVDYVMPPGGTLTMTRITQDAWIEVSRAP